MRALGREGAGLQKKGGSETRPYMNRPYMAWTGALGNKLDAGKREGRYDQNVSEGSLSMRVHA